MSPGNAGILPANARSDTEPIPVKNGALGTAVSLGARTQSTTVGMAGFSTAALIALALAACTPSLDTTTPTTPTTPTTQTTQTTALWLFDEPVGLYPSHTLDDMSDNDMVLSLGLGAQVVPGHHGNALLLGPLDPPLNVPPAEEKHAEFGLARLPPPEGRTVEPLNWFTANYAALMTSGENHLRKQVGHKNPTTNALNLGDFDWTVEFWHSPGNAPGEAPASAPAQGDSPAQAEAVVFELGSGPRGENDIVTQLKWSADRSQFVLVNQPAGAATATATATAVHIPTAPPLATGWRHYAFTYDASASQLRHYLDGTLQPSPSLRRPQPPSKPCRRAKRPTSRSAPTASGTAG